MIPRYTRPEMAKIWDPDTRYRIWFEIEAHAATAQAESGSSRKEAAKRVWENRCAYEPPRRSELGYEGLTE